MVKVCCWEQKFGGVDWCWRPRKFEQAGFLEGAIGCNVAWLVTGKTNGDGLGGSRSGIICVRFQK